MRHWWMVALVGCGGDADPGTPDGNVVPDAAVAFAIAETSPVAGAIDVDPEGIVSVRFTADADSATIDETTFQVTRSGVPVAGEIAYDPADRIATFTPDVRAPLLVGAEVVVTQGVHDLRGNALPEEARWSFVIADGEWSELASVAEGDRYQEDAGPEIGVDAFGNALAVWQFAAATTDDPPVWYHDVWTARYEAGVGWLPASILDTAGTESARHPRIAVNASGEAFATWEQGEGGSRDVWAARYEVGVGWGAPVSLESDAAEASQPAVGVDGVGRAWVVWVQGGAVRLSTFTSADGWVAQPDLEPVNVDVAHSPAIAVSDDGRGVIAYLLLVDGGGYEQTEASYLDGVSGWSAPTRIESTGGQTAFAHASIGVDGTALVTWEQDHDQGLSAIAVNRYTPGVGWGSPTVLGGGVVENAVRPVGAVGPSGDAMVAWTHGQYVEASRFDGTSWSTGAPISEADGNQGLPRIGYDPAGNAMVTWFAYKLVSSRYVPGAGWEQIEVAADPLSGVIGFANLAVAPDGTAVVVSETRPTDVTMRVVASAWR